MLEQFLEMINQADMLTGYTKTDDSIIYNGEEIGVVIVRVPTSETGDYIEAVFHKGTETLIDMNAVHKCSCHK